MIRSYTMLPSQPTAASGESIRYVLRSLDLVSPAVRVTPSLDRYAYAPMVAYRHHVPYGHTVVLSGPPSLARPFRPTGLAVIGERSRFLVTDLRSDDAPQMVDGLPPVPADVFVHGYPLSLETARQSFTVTLLCVPPPLRPPPGLRRRSPLYRAWAIGALHAVRHRIPVPQVLLAVEPL